MVERFSVAVVGGGPAGLQAALTLGRMHIETVLFDDARYRNASSATMHNVLGWDGTDPARLREAGRVELAAYGRVRLVEERVTAVRPDESGFVLVSGTTQWRVERLLFAGGVEDQLLPIPGLQELWGDVVLPCPYCHGHELASGSIAVISSGAHAEHIGALLRGISNSVPVLAPENVVAVHRTESGVSITLRDGDAIEASCVFIPPNPLARSILAESLGVQVGADGIVVDALGRTNRIGIWAAGDGAQRTDPRIPAAVVTAMSAGLTAAADIAAAVAADRDANHLGG